MSLPSRIESKRYSRRGFCRAASAAVALGPLLRLPLQAAAPITPGQQTFTFVQMCDPQFGFGGYEQDLARFEEAVGQINVLRPEFTVICGDLVNKADEKSFSDFKAAKARFAASCYVTAGNHDIGNTPTPESLQFYRKVIGKDYYAFDHKGFAFVVVNSSFWKTAVPGESEKHDAWVKATLEAAAKKNQPIFIVTHHPLFLAEPDEPDQYFNLPIEKRKELLALFKRCGVVAVLAGHTHKTKSLDFQGIQMVTSESTSRNLDKRPFGFRVWHIGPTRPYQHEFVPLKNQGITIDASPH